MKKAASHVAVTGYGILSALGNDRFSFWRAASEGAVGIRKVESLDTSELMTRYGGEVRGFDPTRFMSARERKRTERCSQLAVAAALEAVACAGIDLSRVDPYRAGVVLGTSLGGLRSGDEFHREWLTKGLDRAKPSRLLAYPLHTPADVLSIRFGLKGPKVVISTACAAGANAIGYGCDLIRAGHADLMIVGGVDPLAMLSFAGFNSLKALAPEPCAPYSRSEGISLAEGAGILVLERADLAEARGAKVYAAVAGYGLSSDAYHATAPDPAGSGAIRAVQTALQEAGLSPGEVDYVNGHGTGTRANDSAETKAVEQLFWSQGHKVPISSTKSMIGHTLGAAGAVEAITAVLALNEQTLPPTANFDEANCPYQMDFVPNHGRKAHLETVVSNSFAFGGNNACIALRRTLPAEAPTVQPRRNVVVTGAGVVSASGIGRQEFWAGVREGRGVSPVAAFGEKPYRSRLAGTVDEARCLRFIDPSYARRLDMIGRYSMAAARMAVEDAGLKISRTNQARIGLVFGTSTGPLETVEAVNRTIIQEGPGRVNARLFPNTVMNAAAGHICLALQIKGATTTVATGGVAGAQAIAYAQDLIARGVLDAALVIGADEFHEPVHAGYDRLSILTGTQPRPFDRHRNGFVLGGGASALLLEAEERALERGAQPRASVAGYAMTSDAYRVAGNAPDGEAWAEALRRALQVAGVAPEAVGCVYADGRGAPELDRIEAGALAATFGAKLPPVSTLNATCGYLLGSSATLHAVAALQTLAEGVIPPIAGLEEPLPELGGAAVYGAPLHAKVDSVLISSAAYGGSYAAVVLNRYGG